MGGGWGEERKKSKRSNHLPFHPFFFFTTGLKAKSWFYFLSSFRHFHLIFILFPFFLLRQAMLLESKMAESAQNHLRRNDENCHLFPCLVIAAKGVGIGQEANWQALQASNWIVSGQGPQSEKLPFNYYVHRYETYYMQKKGVRRRESKARICSCNCFGRIHRRIGWWFSYLTLMSVLCFCNIMAFSFQVQIVS